MAIRWRALRGARSACSTHRGGERDGRADIEGSDRRHEVERASFTTDELDVIELIANGHTDLAIARRLSVSVVTVRRRATSFRTKIGARNRAEAVAIAAGRGWLEHPAVRTAREDK